MPEQRDVAHILVKTKALADQLYKRVKAGEDFSTLAKKYSQDPGSKKQGGKLTISKGQTVGPFDQTAFLLKTDAGLAPRSRRSSATTSSRRSAPVKAAKVTPLDAKLKASIRQQLEQQKKNDSMTAWVNKLKKDYNGKIDYQAGYAPPSTAATTTTTG